MSNLDAIAIRLYQTLKALAPPVNSPAPAMALTIAAATPVAPIVKAPEFPTEAVFERDDFGKTVFLDVAFPSGVLRIEPIYGRDGYMVAADFTRISN